MNELVMETCPRCKGDGHMHSIVGFHKENTIVRCPACYGSGAIEKREGVVSINSMHAFSLRELVNRLKQFIEMANIPKTETRSDKWTITYCDELLEDLGEE